MASTIQVRVDDELKIKAEELFRELGTDMTTAIRMFLTQAVAMNGFPFEIRKVNANPYAALTQEELLATIERSYEKVAQKKCQEVQEHSCYIEE